MGDKINKTKKVTLSDGSVVTIREAKLRDIRPHLDEDNIEIRQLKVLSALTQKSDDELDELSYADIQKLLKEGESFL